VVSGIASQTARNSRSIAAFNENFLARLNSLARAHTLLTAGNWQTTPLRMLIEETLSPQARPDEGQLHIIGPDVFLPPKPALAMSMILHELVTNAAKYGALTAPNGGILVEWRVSPSDNPAEDLTVVNLVWRETGVPGLRTPRKTGFGTRMIQASIEHELGGVAKVTYGRDGIEYDFAFPLNQ
jgi:two-component sensor histidine kinase